MSQPRILNVGQCAYDQNSIARQLGRVFQARVTAADTFDEALTELRAGAYDLVLVNRVTDSDGSPGLELIRSLKADPVLAKVPVMLVSDQAQAQAEATSLGALRGFGKSQLRDAATLDALKSALPPTS
jgi:two-component system chemotaxis response regulator CheY